MSRVSISPQLDSAQKIFFDSVRHEVLRNPVTGLILGTGMGFIADEIKESTRIAYSDLPGFEQSTIEGHRGELIVGWLGEKPVVAMNGRTHFYEGHAVNQIRFPILFYYSLGIRNLIVGNASGGVNPKFKSGDVMLIEDHLDLLFRPARPLQHSRGRPCDGLELITKEISDSGRSILDRHFARSKVETYDPRWLAAAETIGRKHALGLRRGVYAALTGPNYETRAEYRMLQRMGADAVGMSTIPEAHAASELGMVVCGLSTITNVADPDTISKTSHDEVIAAVQTAEKTLRRLLTELVMSGPE